MSRTSSRSEPTWSAGPASTRSRNSTVLPTLPSAWLISVRQRVDLRRLRLAGDDQALAPWASRSRATASIQPACAASRPGACDRPAAGSPNAERRGDRPRERGDVPRRHGQPVVGRRAGDRRRALDDVEPVHRRAAVPWQPIADLAPRAAKARASLSRPGPHGEEVGVERRRSRRPCRGDRPARGPRRRPAGSRPGRRRARPARSCAISPRGTARPAAGAGRPGSARSTVSVRIRSPAPLLGAAPRGRSSSERLEVLPGVDPAVARDDLRAVGVVERQDRRLGEGVGRAQAGRDGRGSPRSWSAAPCGSRRARRRRTRPIGTAVAKNSGLPGTICSGASTYGTIDSAG